MFLLGFEELVCQGVLCEFFSVDCLPVPYLTPVTNNSVVAFDVYPKGTPANRSTNTGVAWFDLCSTDVNITSPSFECLRMGKFQNGDSHVSSAAGGTGVVRNLDLQINGYAGVDFQQDGVTEAQLLHAARALRRTLSPPSPGRSSRQ